MGSLVRSDGSFLGRRADHRGGSQPPVRPDTIRGFLDAGGDPTELDGWEVLAEDIVLHRRATGTDRLRKTYAAEEFVARLGNEYRRPVCWGTELLDDAGLLARFEAALPRRVVSDLLALVEEER